MHLYAIYVCICILCWRCYKGILRSWCDEGSECFTLLQIDYIMVNRVAALFKFQLEPFQIFSSCSFFDPKPIKIPGFYCLNPSFLSEACLYFNSLILPNTLRMHLSKLNIFFTKSFSSQLVFWYMQDCICSQ